MPQTVKSPTKLDDETLRAKALLLKYDKADTLGRMAINLKLVPISARAITAAKNSIDLDKRANRRFENQKKGRALPPDEVDRLWLPVLAEIKKSQPRWELALKARTEFRKGVVAYFQALDPLEEALKMGADSGLPGIEKQSAEVLEKLKQARRYLVLVDEKAQKSIADMQAVLGVISVLEAEPPNSHGDIVGAQKLVEDAIVTARNSEEAVKNQVKATNEFCVSAKDSIEKNIAEIVSTIVGWRQSKETREMLDIAEAFVGGAVKAAQIASGEPMSAAAAQGVHMLIKGIFSGLGKIAAYMEKSQIKKEHSDVLTMIELVKPDDFIDWKLDLIKEGLQWLAEPLGFIPSAGALVVACINAATDTIIDSIRAASKKAIEAEEAKKKNPQAPEPDYDPFVEAAEETFTNTFKLMLDDGIETLHELSEYMSGDKSPATIIVKACAAVLGPPLTKILGEVLPAMKPIDKEKLHGAVQGARDSIKQQVSVLETMEKVDLKFAFNLDEAKEKTKAALKDLPIGGNAEVLVGASEAIKGVKCAVLVGSGHSEINRKYMEVLIKSGDGYRGVVYKKKGGTFGSYIFAVPAEGQNWVTAFFKANKDITGKSIEFED